MFCPYCRYPDSRVIDSRTAEDGAAIRRRRSCQECGRRFTTQETVILMVAKRSGATEPFNRDKIVRGVRRACQGRPVTEDQLAILAQRVEEVIRSRGLGEVPSQEVGLAILGPLRQLDEVAYLRFASVYRGFESLADFEAEISSLRAAREAAREAARDAQSKRLGGSDDATAHGLDEEWLAAGEVLVRGANGNGQGNGRNTTSQSNATSEESRVARDGIRAIPKGEGHG
jgi:transcriptional repressor NrdR